jgi:fructose-specific phosphotransferase system IIC component
MKEYYRPSNLISTAFTVSFHLYYFILGLLAVYSIQVSVPYVKLPSILPSIKSSILINISSFPWS